MRSRKVYSLEKSKISESVCDLLEKLSAAAIKKSGHFMVAFSGGSLPEIVAQGLVNPEKKRDIDFTKWWIFFSDERCVPHSSPDSNYNLVKTSILDKLYQLNKDTKNYIPKEQVIKINSKLVHDAELAADDYNSQLVKAFASRETVRYPVFDCILLGVGPDGHTCSLFPHMPQLNVTDIWVTYINNSPKPPSSRITLTLPVVNDAHNVVFVATGASKDTIMDSILNKNDKTLPSTNVNPIRGELFWFLDKDAAKLVNPNIISQL
ncbi:putative 6-phosphogluconolactonase [Zancudomyces culisetae]|uniref:6-phosphogluconolactonase n=1 Tax=Zancudomyces culisetae TaxID=1213189 RepID=A0A1R1PH39_ZANCU|nr:putative 6-phosphogluconolactonase [Zancudomyces culisetae]OMH82420.1 putative 6-phosphogluconolactonase [Zancudomyces culisetae]|eukprot:OMH80315.1 putative 6-phosphogluconolactonase [Zancudomyces culisetae]